MQDLFDGRDSADGPDKDYHQQIAQPPSPALDVYLLAPVLLALALFLTYPLRLAVSHIVGPVALAAESGLGLWTITILVAGLGVLCVKAYRKLK